MGIKTAKLPEPVGWNKNYYFKEFLFNGLPEKVDAILDKLNLELDDLVNKVLANKEVQYFEGIACVMRAHPGYNTDLFYDFNYLYGSGQALGFPVYHGGCFVDETARELCLSHFKEAYDKLIQDAKSRFKKFKPLYLALDIFANVFYAGDTISTDVNIFWPDSQSKPDAVE